MDYALSQVQLGEGRQPLSIVFERRAVHESGHAVAALALGYRARILYLGEVLSVCVHAATFNPWHQLIISLAGEAAEMMFFTHLTERETELRGKHPGHEILADAENVADALAALKARRPKDDVEQMGRAAARVVRAIMKRNLFMHQCLSIKLERLGSLYGVELNSLIDSWDFKTGKHLEGGL